MRINSAMTVTKHLRNGYQVSDQGKIYAYASKFNLIEVAKIVMKFTRGQFFVPLDMYKIATGFVCEGS